MEFKYDIIVVGAGHAGWSAHRLEELITTDKIIRPAYKSLVSKKEYSSHWRRYSCCLCWENLGKAENQRRGV